jgi:cyclopropane fatty-acyl-phospholipid synthase-like methyltransferase
VLEKPDTIVKELWRRIALRGTHYASRHRKFDYFYWIPDPWGMQTDRERHRFAETNRIITLNFGSLHSILEIGSAEGHQSAHLLKICDELLGTDVSEHALARARRRCPSASFIAGDVFSSEFTHPVPRVDLVVACEVLYYVADVPAALRRMEELGRACLVTFYNGEAERMKAYLQSVPALGRQEIRHGDTHWHTVWWRSPI